MKRPERRRRSPTVRRIEAPPPGVDLEAVAAKARYTGSPYHKDMPSFAGPVPRNRPDASICPRSLASQRAQVQGWLQSAIKCGNVGLWSGDFPQRVWHREGDVTFEAVLTRPIAGEYHGYPLEPSEGVEGLR